MTIAYIQSIVFSLFNQNAPSTHNILFSHLNKKLIANRRQHISVIPNLPEKDAHDNETDDDNDNIIIW